MPSGGNWKAEHSYVCFLNVLVGAILPWKSGVAVAFPSTHSAAQREIGTYKSENSCRRRVYRAQSGTGAITATVPLKGASQSRSEANAGVDRLGKGLTTRENVIHQVVRSKLTSVPMIIRVYDTAVADLSPKNLQDFVSPLFS